MSEHMPPPELPPLHYSPASSTAPLPPPAPPPKRFNPGYQMRRIMAVVMGGGLAMAMAVSVAEVSLKPGLRPTDLLATVEAHTEMGVWNQKMGARPGDLSMSEADYRAKLAQAERAGAARAEIVFQKQMMQMQADRERVVGAYQTLFQRANLIAQAALQMEAVAQQFRQQLLAMSNGGRATVIAIQDMLCAAGRIPACEAAHAARAGMIAEADELSRGDVGEKVRALMSGIEDPAAFITREDIKKNGAPSLATD